MMSIKKRNNGNLEQSPAMKRMHVFYQERVDADGDRVFALACPAVTGPSVDRGLGLVVPGPNRPGLLDGSWLPSLVGRPDLQPVAYVTLRDDRRRRLHLFLAAGELVAGKLELEAREQLGGGAMVRAVLTVTALSEQGNALFDEHLGARMGSVLREMVRSFRRALGDAAAAGEREVSATRSLRARHEVAVEGDPDACFMLACPVAELDWIDGWSFDLLYSESGRNEDGCIFREPLSGVGVLRCPGAETTWYTTLYDATTRRFHAVLLTGELMIARFECEVDDLGDGRALMRWELTYSGLNEVGNDIIAEPDFERRALGMLVLLARSAKHYVETGELFRLPPGRRARLMLSVIGAVVGRQISSAWRSAAHPHRGSLLAQLHRR